MKRHRGRIGAAFLAMSLGLPPAGLLAQSASGSSASLTLPPDSVVQALMEARIKLLPYSGMVVGLIDTNGERTLSAGTLNGPGTPAPGAGTLFEIGSVTKTFTATLLADMVRQGEVQLDEPVSELLPDSVQVPQRDAKRITLMDLATQSSGLPRLPTNMHPANMEDPYADYSVAQLYSFLSSYDLPRDPGAKYEYSNLGVGLLGFALARRADTSYEGLVRTRIAEPLAMPDTRIDLTTAEHGRLAPGHNAAGDTVSNWSLPTLAGAGALRSTLHDMMRYLAANLRPDTTTALGRDMRTAHMPRRPTDLPATRIGLVWMVRDTNATRVIWHNGGTGGYHAFIGFDPTRHLGVVMLVNNTRGADDIGLHLLDPSVAISPPPPPPPHRTAVALTPAQLQPYVGRYAIAPGAILTVTLRQDQLFVQLTGQSPLPIYAESDGHFFLKVVDATLDFVRDGKGNVTTAILHQNGRNVTAQRMQGGS